MFSKDFDDYELTLRDSDCFAAQLLFAGLLWMLRRREQCSQVVRIDFMELNSRKRNNGALSVGLSCSELCCDIAGDLAAALDNTFASVSGKSNDLIRSSVFARIRTEYFMKTSSPTQMEPEKEQLVLGMFHKNKADDD
jgi:hypothetical protein